MAQHLDSRCVIPPAPFCHFAPCGAGCWGRNTCRWSQPKHASNPDSGINNGSPRLVYYMGLQAAREQLLVLNELYHNGQSTTLDHSHPHTHHTRCFVSFYCHHISSRNKLNIQPASHSQSQTMTSPPFQNSAINRALRYILHPSTYVSGARCKTRLKSRMKTINPISIMIRISGLDSAFSAIMAMTATDPCVDFEKNEAHIPPTSHCHYQCPLHT